MRQCLSCNEGDDVHILPTPQQDPRLLGDHECSDARGAQNHLTEESVTERDRHSQSQSRVPTPPAFESQPVLNPLPPLSENLLHFSVDWEQASSLPQLANQAHGWRAPFHGDIPGIQIAQADSIPQPVSNPLPPLGDIQGLTQSVWHSPTSQILLEDFAIIDSLSNPLPPFDSRSEAFFFQ